MLWLLPFKGTSKELCSFFFGARILWEAWVVELWGITIQMVVIILIEDKIPRRNGNASCLLFWNPDFKKTMRNRESIFNFTKKIKRKTIGFPWKQTLLWVSFARIQLFCKVKDASYKCTCICNKARKFQQHIYLSETESFWLHSCRSSLLYGLWLWKFLLLLLTLLLIQWTLL